MRSRLRDEAAQLVDIDSSSAPLHRYE
jgi:hypothetical protein